MSGFADNIFQLIRLGTGVLAGSDSVCSINDLAHGLRHRYSASSGIFFISLKV